MSKYITTIYMTDEDIQLKNEIEQSLNGATLTHSTIYRRGLQSLKELSSKNIIKVDLTNNP